MTASDSENPARDAHAGLSDTVLAFGYRAGVVLAGAGMLLAAIYMFAFMSTASDLDPGLSEAVVRYHLVNLTTQKRMLLQSTAIFVGMAFGFLGFSLFLIQARGTVDVAGADGDRSFSIARLTPGLVVVLCATGIIWTAVTYPISYDMKRTQPVDAAGNAVRTGAVDGSVERRSPDVSDDDLGIPGAPGPAGGGG